MHKRFQIARLLGGLDEDDAAVSVAPNFAKFDKLIKAGGKSE